MFCDAADWRQSQRQLPTNPGPQKHGNKARRGSSHLVTKFESVPGQHSRGNGHDDDDIPGKWNKLNDDSDDGAIAKCIPSVRLHWGDATGLRVPDAEHASCCSKPLPRCDGCGILRQKAGRDSVAPIDAY